MPFSPSNRLLLLTLLTGLLLALVLFAQIGPAGLTSAVASYPGPQPYPGQDATVHLPLLTNRFTLPTPTPLPAYP